MIQDIKKPAPRNQQPPSTPVSRPVSRAPESAPNSFPKRKNPAISLPKEVPFVPSTPKGSSKHGLWIIAVVCIIVLVGSLSFLFASATVTVIPKTVPIAFDETDVFTANKDSTDPAALSYTEMSLEGDVAITLPSTQTSVVNSFATGTVTFFNDYATSPFKIAKNTVIKAANGQTYTTNAQISIPAYKASINGNIPGSIDVDVTAATSGEIGDLSDTDFTIPYYAKRPQNGKIYVKLKTPIAGGFSGLMYTIPQASADAAYQSLKDKLLASLTQKTKAQIAPGYLYYDGATLFTTDNSVNIPYSKNSQIPISLHGKLTSYLIKEDSLVQNIATKFVNGYNNESVSIPKISSLTFVLPPNKPLDPVNDTSVTFSFSGTASILWAVDQNNIKSLLVGQPKSDFESILSGLTSVDKADVSIKPFWKQSFPSDIKNITINVTDPLN